MAKGAKIVQLNGEVKSVKIEFGAHTSKDERWNTWFSRSKGISIGSLEQAL